MRDPPHRQINVANEQAAGAAGRWSGRENKRLCANTAQPPQWRR